MIGEKLLFHSSTPKQAKEKRKIATSPDFRSYKSGMSFRDQHGSELEQAHHSGGRIS